MPIAVREDGDHLPTHRPPVLGRLRAERVDQVGVDPANMQHPKRFLLGAIWLLALSHAAYTNSKTGRAEMDWMDSDMAKAKKPEPKVVSATSSTIEDLHLALDANQGDQSLRAVLGDAYAEIGDTDAQEAIAWMASQNKQPDKPRRKRSGADDFGYLFAWCREGSAAHGSNNPIESCTLPRTLYALIGAVSNLTGELRPWSFHASRREAEEAVIYAYRKLNSIQRRFIWNLPILGIDEQIGAIDLGDPSISLQMDV